MFVLFLSVDSNYFQHNGIQILWCTHYGIVSKEYLISVYLGDTLAF